MPDPRRQPESPGDRTRRIGRRTAQGLYWAVVLWLTLGGAISITLQVFEPQVGRGGEALGFASCAEGLGALASGLRTARAAAAGNEGTEDDALARFRGALGPAWASFDRVSELCTGRGDAADERALDAIQRLRYAEEHAVRREAGELAPLRRRVQSLVDEKLAPASGGPSQARPGDKPLP